MTEFLLAKWLYGIDMAQLQNDERRWIGFAFNKISFNLHQKNTRVQQIWKIRKTETKF